MDVGDGVYSLPGPGASHHGCNRRRRFISASEAKVFRCFEIQLPCPALIAAVAMIARQPAVSVRQKQMNFWMQYLQDGWVDKPFQCFCRCNIPSELPGRHFPVFWGHEVHYYSQNAGHSDPPHATVCGTRPLSHLGTPTGSKAAASHLTNSVLPSPGASIVPAREWCSSAIAMALSVKSRSAKEIVGR